MNTNKPSHGQTIFWRIFLVILFTLGLKATPIYGKDDILPSFGNGAIKVVLYADYFCPPCRGIEPQLEPLITDLMKTGKINLIFVDTPTSPHTHLYVQYFIYSLNAKNNFENALQVRNVLFEAAEKRILEKAKLEEFLRLKGMEFKPVDISPVLEFWNRLLMEDNIRSTPSCIITNGVKKEISKGSLEVVKALEDLKEKLSQAKVDNIDRTDDQKTKGQD